MRVASQAGGVDKEVSFVEVDDPDINNRIDAAYREKYAPITRKSHVDDITNPGARSTTIKLVPRSQGTR